MELDSAMTAGPGKSPDSGSEQSSGSRKNSRENIHSGHFMVSDFEAEAEDDEGLEVPEQSDNVEGVEEIKGVRGINQGGVITYAKPTNSQFDATTVSIDASLTKLLKTMSLAYRQKITSPKWNRFKGLKLRWKDKIRLNNVIWRCWHMQYIQRKKMKVCQFSLDVDIHTRPEVIVLEGKYWKRRPEAVTAEYRKWRVNYKNSVSGLEPIQDHQEMSFLGLEEMDWARSFLSNQGVPVEEGDQFPCIDFTDMLFSPFITSPQLFPFPNPREIARGTGNSDLQQPGLMQLQPDLTDNDMMEIQEMLAGKGLGLPTVPEEEYLTETEASAHLGGVAPQPPSPPSVSTPVPTTPIEYTARFTAAQVYHTSGNSPTSLSVSEDPSSPHMFSQDTFLFRENSPQPALAHQSSAVTSSHQQPTQQQVFLPLQSPQNAHQQPPRPFSRSRSDHHLDSKPPTGVAFLQDSDSASFALPKTVPRRRSHSGCITFSSSPGAGLANQVLTPLTTFRSYPQHTVGSSSSRNALESGTIYSTTSDSSLLTHLLTTDSFCNSPAQQLVAVSALNKKVSNLAPRQTFEIVTAGVTGACGSRSNSSSSLNSTNGNSNNTATLTSVTTSAVQPLLLPNVTLSAVTPSSIKSLHLTAQAPKWATSGAIAVPIKASPPYPESTSPQSYFASSPPNKPFRPKSDVERTQYKEHRRVCHINAEQKRRCNIKNNFDTLHILIPSLNQNPNSKVSKAAMLHKGAEYIVQLKQEKQQLMEQAESLRSQIEMLSCDISTAQSLLPATGAPVSHTRHNKMRERFDGYIRDQTLANYKYYIFSLVAEPLMETFNSSVSTASVDDLCRSSMAWLDQHCSLNVLRPIVSNAMRKLSTTTNILTSPEKVPEDIYKMVTKREGKKRLCVPPFSGSSASR